MEYNKIKACFDKCGGWEGEPGKFKIPEIKQNSNENQEEQGQAHAHWLKAVPCTVQWNMAEGARFRLQVDGNSTATRGKT